MCLVVGHLTVLERWLEDAPDDEQRSNVVRGMRGLTGSMRSWTEAATLDAQTSIGLVFTAATNTHLAIMTLFTTPYQEYSALERSA